MERPADFTVRPATTYEAFAALTSTVRLAVSALGYKRVEEILLRLSSMPRKEGASVGSNPFAALGEANEDAQGAYSGESDSKPLTSSRPVDCRPAEGGRPPPRRRRWADLVDDDDF